MNNNQKPNMSTPLPFSVMSDEALTELHRIAKRCMNKERADHTLQATALVNEAYLSLQAADVQTPDKLQFFAMAATHMRNILVDHARAKNAKKREAQHLAVSAEDELLFDSENVTSLVMLDEVLTLFSALDDRAAKMYEMRLFAGLSNVEISQIFDVSVATVERDIRVAKAWINQQFNA